MTGAAAGTRFVDVLSATTHTSERPQRRDATRNRQLVLAAAHDVLAEHGVNATVEQIAARAGVGVGTVYRHYPNKDALIDAFVDSIFEHLIQSATAHCARTDGRGLEHFLTVLGRSLTEHHSYAQVLAARPTAKCGADRLRQVISRLTTQAIAGGRLADWVSVGDVMTLIWALRGVIGTSQRSAPSTWQRYVDIHLSALRADTTPTELPALTRGQLSAIARDQRL